MINLPRMPSMSLEGKTAIVTGASSGIGQGAAAALAGAGAGVICVARGQKRLFETEKALKEGEDLEGIIQKFEEDLKNAKYVIGHNINFDLKIIGAEHFRLSYNSNLNDKINLDTGQISKKYCNLKGGFGGGLKMPKLIEMYEILFNEKFSDAHDASHDVNATAKCFFELAKKGEYVNEDLSPDNINYEGPQLTKSNFQDEEIKDFKKDEVISSEI